MKILTKYVSLIILGGLLTHSTLAVITEEEKQQEHNEEITDNKIDQEILDLETQVKSYLENKGKDTKQDTEIRINLITELNKQVELKKHHNEEELKKLHELAISIGAKNLAQRFQEPMLGDLPDEIVKEILMLNEDFEKLRDIKDFGNIESLSSPEHFKNLKRLIELKGISKKHAKFIEESVTKLSLWKFSNHVDNDFVNDAFLEKIVNAFPNLKELDLESCRDITENGLTSLSKLKNLTHLTFRENEKIINFENLKDIKNLTSLDLNYSSQIKNFDFLKELTNLSVLSLDGANIISLGALEGLKNLTFLNLFNCSNITSLKPLEGLKNLKMLDLTNCNKIQNFDSLQYFTKLETLYLSFCNQIENLNFLKDLKSLTHVHLWSVNIKSLDPLQNLPKLKHVYINGCENLSNEEIKSFEQKGIIMKR
jgi:Leucine-rich repeat (LRR) protein